MLYPIFLLSFFIFLTGYGHKGANAQENNTVEKEISERIKNSDDHNYLSFSYENDLIGSGSDDNYTSGLRVTYFDTEANVPFLIDKVSEFIPTFDINETTSTSYTFGQSLFTPSNINIRANQDDDRPWAGFLYGSVGLATISKNHVDELDVTLGVVGPEALGEQTQKFVHEHLTNSIIPQGWDNQLETEPGVILSWRRRWPIWKTHEFSGLRLRFEPDINASLGNVYTYAGSGISWSIAPYDERIQDTPPRVQPAMGGTGFFDTSDNKLSWSLFGGLHGRAMGRNIFLDGNTFTDSHSVDKNIFVGDSNIGIAFTYDDYRLSYTANYRTKEFEGQDDSTVFGSVTLTARF